MADLDAIKARQAVRRSRMTRLPSEVAIEADLDALLAEVERLRKVAEAARGAAVCTTTQIRDTHSGSLAWPHGPCGHCVGCRIRSALAELEGDDHHSAGCEP